MSEALSKQLAVGVVGLGRIGTHHVHTLLGLDGVSISVTDADPERARRVADELGVQAVATPEALLEAGVDALVIATSTPSHAPLLQLAAASAVAAFCEKPVALDLGTLDRVRDAVERAGIVVQVGFQRRFDAGYEAAREAVVAGDVGKILVMRAATHDPVPPPAEYIAASGGIFADLHIHDFDAVRFVSGEEITQVYADGAALDAPWVDELDDADVAAAILRLSGGGLVIVSGTRRDPLGYDVRLEVFGTAHSIAVGTDTRSPLRSVEPGATRPQVPAYRDFWDRFESAYRKELAAFVETVRAGAPSPCPLAEARAALAVALAAERSRAERRPITIEEVGLAPEPPNG
ncbi:MAG: dehydrogenase [Actinobacteria bacterium]|nr:MAG: dehydrogenase [Actinomycetota bacterium]